MYKKRLSGLFVVFSLVLITLVGCGATGAEFQGVNKISGNKAGVYVYRGGHLVSYGILPDVFIDRHKMGRLKNKGYLYRQVRPGEHQIMLAYRGNFPTFKTIKIMKSVFIGANKHYFFEAVPVFSDTRKGYIGVSSGAHPLLMGKPTFVLERRSESQSLKVLKGLQFSR